MNERHKIHYIDIRPYRQSVEKFLQISQQIVKQNTILKELFGNITYHNQCEIIASGIPSITKILPDFFLHTDYYQDFILQREKLLNIINGMLTGSGKRIEDEIDKLVCLPEYFLITKEYAKCLVSTNSKNKACSSQTQQYSIGNIFENNKKILHYEEVKFLAKAKLPNENFKIELEKDSRLIEIIPNYFIRKDYVTRDMKLIFDRQKLQIVKLAEFIVKKIGKEIELEKLAMKVFNTDKFPIFSLKLISDILLKYFRSRPEFTTSNDSTTMKAYVTAAKPEIIDNPAKETIRKRRKRIKNQDNDDTILKEVFGSFYK